MTWRCRRRCEILAARCECAFPVRQRRPWSWRSAGFRPTASSATATTADRAGGPAWSAPVRHRSGALPRARHGFRRRSDRKACAIDRGAGGGPRRRARRHRRELRRRHRRRFLWRHGRPRAGRSPAGTGAQARPHFGAGGAASQLERGPGNPAADGRARPRRRHGRGSAVDRPRPRHAHLSHAEGIRRALRRRQRRMRTRWRRAMPATICGRAGTPIAG